MTLVNIPIFSDGRIELCKESFFELKSVVHRDLTFPRRRSITSSGQKQSSANARSQRSNLLDRNAAAAYPLKEFHSNAELELTSAFKW